MKLDGKSIQNAIIQLIQEYKFNPQQVLEIVKMGIRSAFRKDFIPNDKKSAIVVSIDKNGNIKILKEYIVMEKVEEPAKEMTLEQAKEYRDDVKMGEQLYIDVTPDKLEFSRIAVQAAAQTIKQNLKKIERERFYDKFQDKQGELLKCKVLKIIGDNIVLDIDATTVVLPPEGQIPNRVYNIGEEIYVLLKQISKGTGGIVLDITQSSIEFIDVILKKNVVELEEGIVKINKIVRVPGKRTKVLISSTDARVDPVGLFVGKHGERISSILSLLEGERIDFVENHEDPVQLIIAAIKPAKVTSVKIVGKKAIISIPEDQKALAIGKGAVNVKLVNQLTGYQIEIR